eukprot:jgi/Psemu1/43817/gm1.43817_g
MGISHFQQPWFELFHLERARSSRSSDLVLVIYERNGLGLGHLSTQQQQQQPNAGLNSNNNPTIICSSQEVYIESLGLPYYALAAWGNGVFTVSGLCAVASTLALASQLQAL